MDATRDGARARGIVPANIPEMERPVGLYGTLRQTEVGGSICFGLVVTISIYSVGKG